MNKLLYIFIYLSFISCGKTSVKEEEKAEVNWDEILPNAKSSDAKAIVSEDPNKSRFSNCYKTNPKVLILDFNKGWWSGLGRGTHEYVVDELKKEACGSDIEITYLYLKNSGQMNQKFAFYNKESFNQVWILSDSLEGMTLSQGEILSNFRKIASWNKPMFIASGEARSEIANLYAKTQNIHAFFTDVSELKSSNIVSYKEFGRQSTINLSKSESDLFKDVPMLMDQLVQETVNITRSARVFSGLEGASSLSNCNSEYSCISIYKEKTILDAGFQRSYGALRSDFGEHTKNYLYNIIRTLSQG